MKLINREISLGLDLLQYLYHSDVPVTAAQMATDLQESEQFIHKILCRLSRRGIVSARRGPGGGFAFKSGTESLTLKGFFETMDKQYSQSIFMHSSASDATNRVLNTTLASVTLGKVLTDEH